VQAYICGKVLASPLWEGAAVPTLLRQSWIYIKWIS